MAKPRVKEEPGAAEVEVADLGVREGPAAAESECVKRRKLSVAEATKTALAAFQSRDEAKKEKADIAKAEKAAKLKEMKEEARKAAAVASSENEDCREDGTCRKGRGSESEARQESRSSGQAWWPDIC